MQKYSALKIKAAQEVTTRRDFSTLVTKLVVSLSLSLAHSFSYHSKFFELFFLYCSASEGRIPFTFTGVFYLYIYICVCIFSYDEESTWNWMVRPLTLISHLVFIFLLHWWSVSTKLVSILKIKELRGLRYLKINWIKVTEIFFFFWN